MGRHCDVVIIGSGVGGGSVARRLAGSGASILVLERGSRLPREDRNWDIEAVYGRGCYKSAERWTDAHGGAIEPGQFYYVGGNSKVFGTAMFRFRREDFDDLDHDGGLSPAWPIDYDDLEPYYGEAEVLFGVHGKAGADPTEPPRSAPYPHPPLAHNPVIADMVERLGGLGLRPFSLPTSVQVHDGGACIRCDTCDGFPCKVGGKGDAEICLIDPALQSADVELRTDSYVERLITDPKGRRITAAEVVRKGESKLVEAGLFVLSAGAINSAALLLRSADDRNPGGLANSSDLVGRHYMNHNASAIMALNPLKANRADFQKTVSINDFYLDDGGGGGPLGNLQSLGKIHEPMLRSAIPFVPAAGRRWLAEHSVDWYAMSEDLPHPESRVMVDGGGGIVLAWRRTNLKTHRRLVAKAKNILRRAGFPIVFDKAFSKATPSHQCGTLRFGADPRAAPLDPFCKAYDHDNLYVVDASFFPSSAALNPALTIAAQGLRAADHMLGKELGRTMDQPVAGRGPAIGGSSR